MHHAILAAYERIRPYVRETPVEESAEIAAGAKVFLKLEHLQRTGSFKFRGASNKIAMLTAQQAAAGVIAASNGNHGMGVAAAAAKRGIAAEVYVSAQVDDAGARRNREIRAHLRNAVAFNQDVLVREHASRANVHHAPRFDQNLLRWLSLRAR